MLEQRRGLRVEVVDDVTGGLSLLAAVVQVAELLQDIGIDGARSAAARVVGEPPAVGGPDEVVRDDDGLRHLGFLVLRRLRLRTQAKPQAANRYRNPASSCSRCQFSRRSFFASSSVSDGFPS